MTRRLEKLIQYNNALLERIADELERQGKAPIALPTKHEGPPAESPPAVVKGRRNRRTNPAVPPARAVRCATCEMTPLEIGVMHGVPKDTVAEDFSKDGNCTWCQAELDRDDAKAG